MTFTRAASGNTFFFLFFFEMAELEYTGLKGPTLGPTGTPSHWHAKPIQMGAVITGMEAKLN